MEHEQADVAEAVAGGLLPSDCLNVALMDRSSQESWGLWGCLDSEAEPQQITLAKLPCRVGRNPQNDLVLTNPTVSQNHARFELADDRLLIRDCGSTNGTFVNGKRLKTESVLRENDCLQFGTASFTVRRRSEDRASVTVGADASLSAMAYVEFGRLIDEPAVQPYFQPIVKLATHERIGFEVLARSSLAGLQFPLEMFRIASERGLQVELSTTARQQGISAAADYGLFGKLFVNTHPDELTDAPALLSDMEQLIRKYPRVEIVVEVHETSIASFSKLVELRRQLTELGIGLAFDDFGAGQSRLLELTTVKPDYIKFDRSLVSRIDQAEADRTGVLRSLVNIVLDLGITPLAEGIETPEEAEVCRQFGFELAQGYLFGRPLAACAWASDRSERKASFALRPSAGEAKR